jgi:spore coat polysaccharide biosynthesis protein SpsF (cytidylyltransferase family)
MLDWMIRNSGPVDFMSNTFAPRNLPDGWDIEVMSPRCLNWLDDHATVPEREHVTQALYQHEDEYTRDGLSLCKIHYPLDLSNLKISIDTQADLEYVKGLYRP